MSAVAARKSRGGASSPDRRTIAAIDVGSGSVRMCVAEAHADGRYTPLETLAHAATSWGCVAWCRPVAWSRRFGLADGHERSRKSSLSPLSVPVRLSICWPRRTAAESPSKSKPASPTRPSTSANALRQESTGSFWRRQRAPSGTASRPPCRRVQRSA